ncbi:MAG: tail fiber domain-containing protein [Magnetococcales bacterium]|nr:tail fiber domain-containing protein [Magnetococcales bacterium]
MGIGTLAPSHILHITGAGRSTQAAWDTSSDERIKRNICDIQNALASIMALRPRQFQYIEGVKADVPPEELGFVAQEVEQVIPYAVTTVPEERLFSGEVIKDMRLLNTSPIIPLLVRGMQEQQAMIQQLLEMVAVIEERLSIIGELHP